MRKSGGVVPQPHPDIVAEPVCMRMVQFQGKFKGVSVSTEFDQTGFNPNTPRVLPRYRVTADPHFTTAYSNLQQEYKKV